MSQKTNITCTPDSLLANFPCGACLSKKQLLAVIVLLSCKLNGEGRETDCSAKTLLENAKCFVCMSDHQMLEALASIMFQLAVKLEEIESEEQIRREIACLYCLTPKQLYAIILKQFCDEYGGRVLL